MPTDPSAPPDYRGGMPGAYGDPGYGADAALDAFAQPDALQPPVARAALTGHHVTAVLVSHEGARWLPQALAALTASDHRPDRLVGVDTGSRDESASLLTDVLGAHAVTTMPKRTGFGRAVRAGIAHADRQAPARQAASGRTEWVWLLHDDCAPAPDALRRLLECAVRHPEAAVIGPKVRSWREEKQLLEVGLTMTGGGRRHTGLEKREYDQGQHDTTREVLAVGSAGMLVRRDVWDELGGFDKHLAVFRDDIDFGWRVNLAGHPVVVCPDAVVQHAEAAAHGRRRLGATRQRPHLVDRRNALYVLLANAPGKWWLFTLLRTVLGGVGRAVGFLLGKQPALAIEELLAVLAVVGRPDRLIRARFVRARSRTVDHTTLRRFFPSPSQQLRNAGETVLGLVSGTGTAHDLPTSHRRAVTEPESEDDEPATDDSALVRALTRPPVLLAAALVAVTLAASRGLIGSGRLAGGALFPAPDTTAALWAAYTEPWHGVGVGSGTATPPYIAVVAALGSVLRSPSLAVDVLLVGSVPLAGLTAYLLLRKVVVSARLRFWAAAVYALLPATTGAIAAGRLGTAAAAVLTPLVALAVLRTLGPRDDPGPFRAAWSAGLLLAVVVAFVPLAWVAAVLLAVVGVAAGYGRPGMLARFVVILGVPPVVLAPWTFEVLDSPALLLAEAGVPGPGLSESALAPWAVLLQHPGGPGVAPVWLGAGVLLAGWVALFTRHARGLVVTGWAVALVGFGLGLLVSRLPVSGPTLETPVSGWPGYATVLVGGGLTIAAAGAATGLRERLRSASFGWRQPLAVLLTVAAGLTPLVAAGWWVWRGADGPVERGDPAVLPAYVAVESQQPDRVRTLVLNRTDDGRVTYALLRRAGPQLGDAETGPPHAQHAALEDVVADLVSERGGSDASALVDFAARYVYLPPPADPELVERLDTVSGLSRASAPEGAAMWQVAGDVARARVIGESEEPVLLDSGDVTAGGRIPPADGDAGRLLVLAEHADPGWSATLSGEPLPSTTYDGWAQAFEVPASGGDVRVTHLGPERRTWLTAQLGVALVVVVLALPGMRRQRGAVEGAADVGLDDSSTDLPAVAPRAAASRVPAGVGAGSPAPLPEPPTPPPPAPMAEPPTPPPRPVRPMQEPPTPPPQRMPEAPGAWLEAEGPEASEAPESAGHGRHAGRRARRSTGRGVPEEGSAGDRRRSSGRGGRRAKGRRRRGGDT